MTFVYTVLKNFLAENHLTKKDMADFSERRKTKGRMIRNQI
jgi:hypothetical protein